MSSVIVISIVLVLLGIVLMSASISGGLRLNHELPAELKGRWQLMTAFMVFFDVGYIVFVFLLTSEIHFPIEPLVGLILIGGAVFVFMFIKQTGITVRRMNELQKTALLSNEKLKESNAKLLEEVREREKVDIELRESKTRLENIFNNSIPLCLTNTDFEIVDANEAYYSYFGGSEAIPLRHKCYDSRPGPICNTDACMLNRIMAGEQEVLCEAEKIDGKGIRHRFLVTARPWIEEDGRVTGIVESFQDITQLKLAEEALAEEKERLQVTLASIGDGVIAVDLRGRIVLINDTARNMIGRPGEDMVGKGLDKVLNLVDPHDREKSMDLMTGFSNARTGESGHDSGIKGQAALLITGNGPERLINYSFSPINAREGQVFGAVLVFQDITEKLKIEKESTRIEKLESISLLASGVAHDFNNILTAIMNNLTLARMVVGSEEKLLEKLDSTEEAVLKAKELTSQLLTFAKGGTSFKSRVSIGDLVKSSAEFSLRGSNVRSEFSSDEKLWPVEVDEVQIHQVISNLVINADQAMPGGGVLSISLENCFIRPGESALIGEGRYVKLVIRDQGLGIGEDNLAKIFDPYFTTKPEGSGLGLATVYSIISKHGGYIFVDSEEGRGTTFTIFLPAAESDVIEESPGTKVSEAAALERKSAAGSKILIMDDEADIRELLGELLRNAGFKVVAARDGEEALKMYREVMDSDKRFDCVIMDLTIPGGMGGREAIQRLMETDPDAKAIVSSGYANDPVMLDYEKYGFLGRVAKPYRLEVLLDTINDVVCKGRELMH